jgi:hypothetical protein
MMIDMWRSKMYFSGDCEIIEYTTYKHRTISVARQELPFLESLLSFQELDCEKITPMLRRISENWEYFVMEYNRGVRPAALYELEYLSYYHIYLNLLYEYLNYHNQGMRFPSERNKMETQKILWELHYLPDQLPRYQKEIRRCFELVLDVDTAGRNPQKQAAIRYSSNTPIDSSLFKFHPIPVNFEQVEPGRCSPVLYSVSIRDMIDYSLRSCVERGITVRRCKHCGRYFPQTGRVSAEYCERPVAPGEQRCREFGAFKNWSKKQIEDPVVKAYRREYKRRFAWIKAGRITDEAFYAWSAKARAEKKKCEQGTISLDEFNRWLDES